MFCVFGFSSSKSGIYESKTKQNKNHKLGKEIDLTNEEIKPRTVAAEGYRSH